MQTKQPNSAKVKSNMKIVSFVFFFVGLVFISFGLTSDNSSITTGGVIVLTFGFFAFLLPTLIQKNK